MTRLTNFIANPFRALLIVCAVMLLCFAFGTGVAANETGDRKFSRKIGKATVEALDLINRQDYEAATLKLESLLKKKKLSSYERSTILQMNGQAYFQLQKTQDAIQAFEDAISAGGLLPTDASLLRKTIANLYILEKDYARGAEMLEQWERGGNTLKPAALEQLVQAWIMAENYERALPWAEQWFEASNPKQRKHYDLLNFLYTHLEQTEKRKNLLQVMAEKWPNDPLIQRQLNPVVPNTGQSTVGMFPVFQSLQTDKPGNFKITGNDRDAQPIVRIPPTMPVGITFSGHCDVRFNVTAKGRPFDVQTTSCTDKVFEAAAIETIEKWKYNPKIRDDQAMNRTGVETRIKFSVAKLSK